MITHLIYALHVMSTACIVSALGTLAAMAAWSVRDWAATR